MSYSDKISQLEKAMDLVKQQQETLVVTTLIDFDEDNDDFIVDIKNSYGGVLDDLGYKRDTLMEQWREECPEDFNDGSDDASMRAWHHGRVL